MFRRLTTALLVAIFAYSHLVDAKADESLVMKVFNHNFRVSDSQMHAMLKKANLLSFGYKKEVTTKQVQPAGGGKPQYQKAYFFYKVVNCSQIMEVEQELNRLFPGVFGGDVDSKFKKEIKFRHLVDSKGQCTVGLEVHFKESEGCYANQAVKTRRKKRAFDCWFCKGCKVVKKEDL